MSFREAEAETYILQKEAAEKNALEFSFPCRCIRLDTPTALTDVGITARVSKLLAQNDIPCNVVAAYHHDYFFIPESLAMKAKQVLERDLQYQQSELRHARTELVLRTQQLKLTKEEVKLVLLLLLLLSDLLDIRLTTRLMLVLCGLLGKLLVLSHRAVIANVHRDRVPQRGHVVIGTVPSLDFVAWT